MGPLRGVEKCRGREEDDRSLSRRPFLESWQKCMKSSPRLGMRIGRRTQSGWGPVDNLSRGEVSDKLSAKLGALVK